MSYWAFSWGWGAQKIVLDYFEWLRRLSSLHSHLFTLISSLSSVPPRQTIRPAGVFVSSTNHRGSKCKRQACGMPLSPPAVKQSARRAICFTSQLRAGRQALPASLLGSAPPRESSEHGPPLSGCLPSVAGTPRLQRLPRWRPARRGWSFISSLILTAP
jgi:hypothetical protein